MLMGPKEEEEEEGLCVRAGGQAALTFIPCCIKK
jgi:hypothetical protein